MKTFDDSQILTYNGVQVQKLSVPGIVLYQREVLPYIPLQYVQSDRTQYVYAIEDVNSQYVFANPGIDMKFDWLDGNPTNRGSHYGFGCERRSNSNYRWTIGNWSNGSSIKGELFTGVNNYNIGIATGSNFRIVVRRNKNSASYNIRCPNYIEIYKDNVLTSSTVMTNGRTETTPANYYNGNHFCLFGIQHSSGNAPDPTKNGFTGKVRLYYFKAYNYDSNGDPYLVCDLVPAKDKTTGRVGLWDNVRSVMRYSVSSSDLIAGPQA